MKKYFILLMTPLLFTACQVMQEVSFDQLMPATISYGVPVHKVGVVNNVLPPDNSKNVEQAISPKIVVKQVDGDGRKTAQEFAQRLADEHYFDKVVIVDSLFHDPKKGRDNSLTLGEVNDLAQSLDVDVIYTIDKQQTLFQEGLYYEEGNDYLTVATIAKFAAKVSVYLPHRIVAVASFIAADSVLLGVGDWKPSQQVVEEMSALAGNFPLDYLIPTWQTRYRNFYAAGSIPMKDAAFYALTGDWEEAYKRWKTIYKVNTKDKMRIYSSYNIAVYFEVAGDIDKALEWATICKKILEKNPKWLSSDKYTRVVLYLAQLEDRKKEVLLLKRQLL